MKDTAKNPLIDPPKLLYGAPALDDVRPEHFLPAVRHGIAEARKKIDDIKNNPEMPSFKNTIEALEFHDATLSRIHGVFTNYISVKSDDEVKDIDAAISVALSEHENEIMTDAALFERVRAVYDARDKLGLSGEEKMLLTETYRDFVTGGALLAPETKTEFCEIDEKITALNTLYQNNLLNAIGDYKKVIEDEKQLAGLPERLKSLYRSAADNAGMAGKWVIELLPPPVELLDYADDRALREEIYLAMNTVAHGGAHDNGPVALEIVRLRHQQAALLGFDNYADLAAAGRMAGTAQTVNDFLDRLETVYKPAAQTHLQEVRDYALRTDTLSDLKPWDFRYYNRKMQEELFNIDVESTRPYFELENVLKGMARHAEKLFDVEVRETKGTYPVHHPDIRPFEVIDKGSGDVIGLIYADYYARPGSKNTGAWMENFQERGQRDGKDGISIILSATNFAKPTAGEPTLLSLEDVKYLFHEFGHCLHSILCRGKYPSINGTNVKWDFLELPSQLQENWVREKDVLADFAVHYKTGEKIPTALIEKLLEIEKFNAAYVGLQQTYFSRLDMAYYTADPDKITDIAAFERGVAGKSWIFPDDPAVVSTSFDHIFAAENYAAGFYSYKWAEVLDADVFAAFKEKGLYDKDTARRLKETIFEKGGTVDPMELFTAFRGRAPDPDALFRREGLAAPKKKVEPKPKGPAP